MEVLQTRVFPRIDRDAVLSVLLADRRQGMPLLFGLADKAAASVSGCGRLSRILTSRHPGVRGSGAATLSNFSDGYLPLSEGDVEAIVKGLGTRFPCDYGWVMSVHSLNAFLEFFGGVPDAVNQNSFLPGACNVFCFGVFGALALSVRALDPDTALARIEGDDPREPYGAPGWGYVHFRLDGEDRAKVAAMMRSRGAELGQRLRALAGAVGSRRMEPREASGDVPRVPLSSIARRRFRKMGYVWNRQESEPRVTVLDKVTGNGNVIRVTADAGGTNEVIPYVSARFIGASFLSGPFPVVSVQGVADAGELRSLLERHEADLHYFEQRIASTYDREMGQCHPAITRRIRDHRVRSIQ